MTPDGIPIIDRVAGVDGLILAVGMCGQGFMMGPGVAVNVTSLICDGKSSLPEDVQKTFRYDRDFYASKTERLK
jgi:sarcosine oxidase subunit beta